jgi:hypothetical protein
MFFKWAQKFNLEIMEPQFKLSASIIKYRFIIYDIIERNYFPHISGELWNTIPYYKHVSVP